MLGISSHPLYNLDLVRHLIPIRDTKNSLPISILWSATYDVLGIFANQFGPLDCPFRIGGRH